VAITPKLYAHPANLLPDGEKRTVLSTYELITNQNPLQQINALPSLNFYKNRSQCDLSSCVSKQEN
jgi:hypothetical protein